MRSFKYLRRARSLLRVVEIAQEVFATLAQSYAIKPIHCVRGFIIARFGEFFFRGKDSRFN